MTKPAPPSDCSQPPAFTTFSTTDEAAYLWFLATGALKGDVFATEYYDPAGLFYAAASGSWDPLAEDGDYCFTDVPFYIAGYPPASKPGTWTVIGRLNGGQIFELTFTITGGSSTCTYNITPASDSIAASGGTGAVLVTTDSSCTWTATSDVSWIHISSGGSGTGSGTVSYSADANTGASRTGTLTIAGKTFTLAQAGGSSSGSPTIAAGGITNAASNRAGKIACGGFFTIYGTNLGPATPQWALSFPLLDNMGNVVVTVTQGSTSKRAYLHYISANQINAILPSSMPDGAATVVVTYQGNASAPEPVTVIDTSLGIFTMAGGAGPGIIQNFTSVADQGLNSLAHSAKPGQIEIMWATGLGPIDTPDNMPPPGGNMAIPVQVLVGGKNAAISYAGRAPNFSGVDNIYFTVPADAPQGCSVPVQVKAGDAWSNTVRMAINGNGQHCQDAVNPFGGLLTNGGKTGGIILLRAGLSGQLDSSQPPVNITLDLAAGIFTENKPSGEFAFSPLLSLPPIGTCVSTERSLDLASVLADPNSLGLGLGRQLDAGPALQLTGAGAPVSMKQADAQKTPGLYIAIGGSIPIEGITLPPPFLDGSSYTVQGNGGADVGPFSATVIMPAKITWSNRDQLTTVNRAAGATITWTGGDSSQAVLIAGGSTNQKTKDSGGFFCLAPGDARQFVIPPNILADVPPTGATASLSDSLGALLVVSLPKASQTFAAPQLDTGFAFVANAFIGVVQYK